MKRFALLVGVFSVLAGCSSADLNHSLFPAVPEQPAKKVPADKADEKQHPPVTPSQVNDRNARQALRELDAELENDGAKK